MCACCVFARTDAPICMCFVAVIENTSYLLVSVCCCGLCDGKHTFQTLSPPPPPPSQFPHRPAPPRPRAGRACARGRAHARRLRRVRKRVPLEVVAARELRGEQRVRGVGGAQQQDITGMRPACPLCAFRADSPARRLSTNMRCARIYPYSALETGRETSTVVSLFFCIHLR